MIHLRLLIFCFPAMIPTIIHAQPGRIDTLFIPGRLSGEERIFVWIPAQGTDSIRNIIYMHDAQNLFDPTTTWNGTSWMVREALDSLISHRYIQPTLLVALPNTPHRHAEYTPEKPFRSLPPDHQQYYLTATRPGGLPYYTSDLMADAYLDYLTTRVVPEIQLRYIPRYRPIQSYILGSSMGGLISWYAVLMYPDIFDGAACFATHWPLTHEIPSPAGESFISFFHQKFQTVKDKKWYFDSGGRGIDTLYQPYQQAVDRLFQSVGDLRSFRSFYYPNHDHSEIYWKLRFPSAIECLVN
ncbi:MAG: alpha/beta hydrolase [Thermaurantimonas sp.]